MNRKEAPAVKPFGGLTMPPEETEVLPNEIVLHRIAGGYQPVCSLGFLFSGGPVEFRNCLTPALVIKNLCEGSAAYSTDRLADILDFNGARLSSTGHQHHSCVTVSMLNHRLEALLPAIADFIQHPAFPEKQLETSRLALKANISTARAEVTSGAIIAFNELMMGRDYPAANQFDTGLLEGFGSADAKAMYARMMCPSKMHVALSGLIDDSMTESVRRVLGSFRPLSDGVATGILPYAPVKEPVHLTVKHDNTFQSAIATGAPAIPRSHPDYIPLRLSVIALGGYFGSRLTRNIREEKALTYGINASLNGSLDGSFLQIFATSDRKYVGRVLDEVAVELRRLASDPPHGDELERLKRLEMSNLAGLLDTPFRRKDYFLNQITIGTPKNYFEAQCEAIRTLTSEKISEMASRYLNPDRFSSVVAGAEQ